MQITRIYPSQINVSIEELIEKTYPIKTIFNDSSIHGEGEHKIMQYLKKINESDINIVHGLDADLIMLSMIKSNKIYLLRERTEYNIEGFDSEFESAFKLNAELY